ALQSRSGLRVTERGARVTGAHGTCAPEAGGESKDGEGTGSGRRTMGRVHHRSGAVAVIALTIVCGCVEAADEQAGGPGAAAPPVAERPTMPPDSAVLPPQAAGAGNLRLEIDVSERELRVYEDGELVETHPVAVGSAEYPTPTGD